MRAPKVCSHPRCPNLQPCPDHERKPWAGSTRRSRLPKGWDKKRRYVLQRDPICQDGSVCKGLALSTQVDHIVPGDDHSYDNLQGICADCHKAKTQAEAQRGKAK